MDTPKDYFAFISYKREDEKWAKWLQHKLEHYRLPLKVRKENANLPKEIRPVFRDVTDLSIGVLADEIQHALEQSKYLIVICSPRATQSIWICKEIKAFIDLNRTEYIIPFIIGGTPFSNNPSEECFPEELRCLPQSKELLGTNINDMGRDAAVIKVVAQMFGLRFDTLWQRHEREKRRKRWLWIIFTILLGLLGLSIGGWFLHQNNVIDGQRSQLRNDSIMLANHITRIQQDSLKLSLQKDSILAQEAKIRQTNEELKRSNILLTQERNNVLKANSIILQERNHMLISQSRAIAKEIHNLINKGDLFTAQLLALEILPKNLLNPNRPYTAEAEIALRKALIPFESPLYKSVSYCRGEYDNNCDNFAFSPKGDKILFHNGGYLFLHDIKNGKETKLRFNSDFTGRFIDLLSCGFNIDGTKVFGKDMYMCAIWDVTTNKNIQTIFASNMTNDKINDFWEDSDYNVVSEIDNSFKNPVPIKENISLDFYENYAIIKDSTNNEIYRITDYKFNNYSFK